MNYHAGGPARPWIIAAYMLCLSAIFMAKQWECHET